MRIDQDGGNPGASEHCSRGRTGKAAADDRNVGVLHGESRPGNLIFATEWQKKA
jgi:aminoglycoside phosphotransferase (APT) family kinase protein